MQKNMKDLRYQMTCCQIHIVHRSRKYHNALQKTFEFYSKSSDYLCSTLLKLLPTGSPELISYGTKNCCQRILARQSLTRDFFPTKLQNDSLTVFQLVTVCMAVHREAPCPVLMVSLIHLFNLGEKLKQNRAYKNSNSAF